MLTRVSLKDTWRGLEEMTDDLPWTSAGCSARFNAITATMVRGWRLEVDKDQWLRRYRLVRSV